MPNHVQNWVDVAAEEDCVEGHAIEVLVEGTLIAVFHDDGQWYAMDGMCAHQGGPIAQGHVAAGCVTCPWHGWQYELSTGIQTINRQPLQKTYSVRAIDGRIEIDMNS
ncbi:Rieske (2Fe-2S) protein [Novipirellula maiorica]|nr:Rieske 2Fe-2S domain-containing protein [Rhodopirellula maiorica]